MHWAAAAGIMDGREVETPALRTRVRGLVFLFGMECAVGRPASRIGRAVSVRSLKGRDGLAQPTMGGSLSPIRVTFELHVPDGTWGLTDIAEVGCGHLAT